MFKHTGKFVFALAGALAAGGLSAAKAADCLDVKFSETAKVASTDLVLNGMGIRKATMFEVKVYVAGLYLPQKSSDGQAIVASDQPWHLELHFVRDVDASDIRDAFEEGFEKAAGDSLGDLKPRIDALKAQMADFNEGHVLAYSYDPASGTVVDVNGAMGAPIGGADFASALLAISVGPNPPNEDLKTGLLGGPCE